MLARAIRSLRRDGPISFGRKAVQHTADSVLSLDALNGVACRLSRYRLRRRMAEEDDLSDVLDTVFEFRGYGSYDGIAPIQIRGEIRELAERVRARNPKTVLEIGTANGGTFYIWCRYLPTAEKIVSLDLPAGAFGGGYEREKIPLFRAFSDEADLHFIRADSHEEATLETVEDAVAGESVDFLFIDGDHSYEGVRADFQMYSPLVESGGLVAFHDIVPGPSENVGGVPEFWAELSETYPDRTERIVEDPAQEGYGIGLYHPE